MKLSQGVTSIIIAILFAPGLSQATLGESESSIEKVRQGMRGSSKVISAQGYTVHEIAAKTQTVKEYVGPDGIVFAVSWKGAFTPDLSVLLGSYFEEFNSADADAPKSKGRSPVHFRTSRLVVKRDGHMRSVRGKVFVPSLVPQGINPDELP